MSEIKPMAILLVFVMALAPMARADVLSPGTRYVRMEAVVELGALADQSWAVHVVKPNDSLWKIARTHYGDGERWGEIAAANSGVDPKRLRPGARLELPPKTRFVMKDGRRISLTAWRFYWWPDPRMTTDGPVLVAPGEKVGSARYSGVLIAIPHERKLELEKAVARGVHDAWDLAMKVPEIAKSESVTMRGAVKKADPTRTIVTVCTLKSVAKGSITMAQKELRLGEDGKELTWSETRRAPLFAASSVGAILLTGVYFRRRRRNIEPVAAH